jgi:tRNA threonylcarbamoyladenosine biosynthesis protein TsaE
LSDVVVHVPTAEDMRLLGAALGRAAVAGDRFLLSGPFGAGKTTFVQGLARGLDVQTPVGSPSFVIETQYRGRLTLYHIDLYRVDRVEPDLVQELVEDLFNDGVAAVEWAERLPAELAADATHAQFQIHDEGRIVTLSGDDERITAALEHR